MPMNMFRIVGAALLLAVPVSAAGQRVTDPPAPDSEYTMEFLPYGLLYRSYIAGEKEPRISAQWFFNPDTGWIWETAFGTRVPAFRYGTQDPRSPEGLQMDVEGAAFTRIDVGTGTEVDAVDFRTGFLLTWRKGRTAIKGGMYHISSHIGDEYLQRNPNFVRRDYVRDSLIVGIMRDLSPVVSAYVEVAYAKGRQDGAEPYEVQFGVQYDPEPRRGSPGRVFGALNLHYREEFGFRPTFNTVGGVQWKSSQSRRTIRVGLQYFNGQSLQYSFYDLHEEWLGIGVWLDM